MALQQADLPSEPNAPSPAMERAAPAAWRGRLFTGGAGVLVGLAGVALISVVVYLLDTRLIQIPSPSLTYLLLILGVAYWWGWRVGAVTAVVAFLALWYVLLLPHRSWSLSAPGEGARLVLAALTYGALVVVGDSLRRLRRANANLVRAVERFDTIITSIADGVIITDHLGNVVQTNEAMRRILGGLPVPRTPAERRAVWQTRWGDGQHVPVGSGPLSRALAGEVVTRDEVMLRNGRGEEVSLQVSVAPLRDLDGRVVGVVEVCRDVSELRRLQMAKDDFLSVASHELKTPLTSLTGYIQLLQRHLGRTGLTDERAVRYLSAIDTQTRRMRELVDTLLDVSRLETGKLRLRDEPVDLVALVREVVEGAVELSDRHPVTVEAEAARIEGRGDADRIEQVITNLLSNAVRYSPDGGPIAVTIGTLRGEPAADSTGAGAEMAFVRVRDTGLGLPADQLDRVFERFHQVHGTENAMIGNEGMGLGLYISHEIVERHGGRIWAESDGPDRGAAFTFTVPLASAPIAEGGGQQAEGRRQ